MPQTDPLTLIEDELRAAGRTVAGVDEAGRGCLAGPVAAGAVILDPGRPVRGLRDSKKLTEKRREELFAEIREKSAAWSVAMTGPGEIDRTNILRAALRAMEKAVAGLSVAPDFVLVDGNARISIAVEQKTVVGGDDRCASIAAASIVAKVTRDRLMRELETEYPGYGFSRHKGYPSKEHRESLRRLGPCPIHRKSFNGVL